MLEQMLEASLRVFSQTLLYLLVLLVSPAWALAAAPAEVTVRTSAIGTSLTSGSGTSARTLYVLDKDTDAPGGSACDAKCEQIWPPLLAAAGARADGDWTLVHRASGVEQWAFKGRPLYTFAKDDTPTATYGDGIGRVWHRAFEPLVLPPGITLHKTLKGDVLADARGHTAYYVDGAGTSREARLRGRVPQALGSAAGAPHRTSDGRLVGVQPRRWHYAVGVQGKAALCLRRRLAARRRTRR